MENDIPPAQEPTSPPPPPQQAPPVAQTNPNTWAMLCHLTALVGFIGPLIIWLVKKDELSIVDEHGKESLNFQISMTIYSIVAAFLTIILIGFILLPILGILNLVLVIVASVKASNGELYRYPLAIRFLK